MGKLVDDFVQGARNVVDRSVDALSDIGNKVWNLASDYASEAFNLMTLGAWRALEDWLQDMFAPPPDQGYQVQRNFDTNKSLGIVYGEEIKIAGTVVAKEVSGDYKYLHVFYAFATEKTTLKEIYIDGQSGVDSQYVYNPVTNTYNTATRFNGKVLFKVANTTSGLGTTPTLNGCTIYDQTKDLFGKMVVVYARYTYDRDVYQGEPQIYALASSLDTTLSNPAKALKDYLSVSEYGARIDPSKIDATSFTAAETLCDELVTIPATLGTRKRYTVNTVLDTKKKIGDNVELLKQVMDADLFYEDGLYKIKLRGQGDAVVTFDHDNIVGDVSFSTPDQGQLFNLVGVNFTDKNTAYKTNTAYFKSSDLTYPYAGYTSDFKLSRDDGVEKEKRITLNGVTGFYEAQAYAEKILRGSLFSQTCDVTTSWQPSEANVGDIVGLTVTEFGFANKEFRVLEKKVNLAGTINWKLMEHDDSIYTIEYDNAEPSAGTVTYPNPWAKLPAPTDLVVTRTGIDQALLSFTEVDSDIVDRYVAEVIFDADPTKIYKYESNSSPIYYEVSEVGNFTVSLYAISDLQIKGNVATINAQLDLDPPTGLTLNSGTDYLIKNSDGTINSRIFVSFTASSNQFVTAYEISYKRVIEPNYKSIIVTGNSGYIDLVEDGAIYEVRVRSISGSYFSTWNQLQHTVIGKTAPPDNVANFTGIVRPFFIDLTWDDNDDVDLAGYEIRKGADWDTATQIFKGRATAFKWDTQPSGTESLLIKAYDTTGNYSSTATQAAIVIQNPLKPVFSAVTVDNFILLSWSNATTSFSIDRYVVYRGIAFTNAQEIIQTNSTTEAYFETEAGTYTYWVQAVDIQGNKGEPSNVIANVDQPPDFVLQANQNLDLSDINSSSNIRIETDTGLTADSDVITVDSTLFTADELSNSIILAPYDTTLTYEDRFTPYIRSDLVRTDSNVITVDSSLVTTDNALPSLQDLNNAGFTLWAQPTPSTAHVEYLIDFQGVFGLSRIEVTPYIEQIAGNVNIQYTVSYSSDNITYTDSNSLSVVGRDFRYVKIRVDFTSATGIDLCRIDQIGIKLDVKERTDSGNGTSLASDTGGTQVNFNKVFVDINSITVSPNATIPVLAVYDFVDIPNPTGFKVLLFDQSTGARIDGAFSWNCRGV